MGTMKLTPDFFNDWSIEYLPALHGISVTLVKPAEIRAEMQVTKSLLAPNGYLHAGAIVTLADTCAGYGCFTSLPKGATGFTTVELKSNHIGTVRDGFVKCVAKAVHLGGSTQVWDATVTSKASGKTIALFRCTQMILYKKKTP